MNVNEIREKILDLLYSPKRPRLTKAQLFFSTQTNPKDGKIFDSAVLNLERSEVIVVDKKITSVPEYKIGYLQSFSKTEHYVYIGKNKYFATICLNAIHGDKVIYKIIDELLLTVEIITVIKRKKETLSGTYVESNGIGFVIPDKEKYGVDIYVIGDKPNPYDKVVIQIDEYKIFGKPEGNILRKIEGESLNDVSPLDYILDKYEVSRDFPADVIKKSILLNVKPKSSLFNDRIDLRGDLIFTVDGKTSKDFDDAISIVKVGNNYEIGVYIADVSYYVDENGVIDKEAFKRGTSYYLDDTCIPMLPVGLSNGICSLNEGCDRLCIGLRVVMDMNGGIVSRELFECVINSKKRYTYEDINAYLNGELDDIDNADTIELTIEASQILREKRSARGNIDFNFNEIDVNETEVFEHVRGPSNKMIEEFMIMANENIAEMINETSHPFVYRIHDVPFKEKVEGLIASCNELSIDTSMLDVDDIKSKQFQQLIETLPEKLKRCLNMSLITTMKQAKYAKVLSPHFGLASDAYCHFTSPIRRYPDLFNHRIVKRYIRRRLGSDDARSYYDVVAEKVSKHCCFTERNASRAEDELLQIKIMNYMTENPDKTFTGMIYSKAQNGYFVLLDNNLTGFVRSKEDIALGDEIHVYFKEFEVKSGKLIFDIVGEA